MALTPGQRRWLDRQVGSDNEQVVTGAVAQVEDKGDGGSRVVIAGSAPAAATAYLDLPAEAAPAIGESASVLVTGEVTGWVEDGDATFLEVTGDAGSYRVPVEAPRTAAEQTAHEERRQAAEAARAQESDRLAAEAAAAAEAERDTREQARLARRQRAATATSVQALREVVAEILDRLDPPPPPAQQSS